MEKPKYIEFVEQNENIFFSEYQVGIVDIGLDKLKKLELVHIESDYPRDNTATMIYAANKKDKIYLRLKQAGQPNQYKFTCYFLPEKMSIVEIYIKSLLNKKN